jgi:hypothetical protein
VKKAIQSLIQFLTRCSRFVIVLTVVFFGTLIVDAVWPNAMPWFHTQSSLHQSMLCIFVALNVIEIVVLTVPNIALARHATLSTNLNQPQPTLTNP